ncbi:MAG: hypothetical protein AB7I50_10905 [Vicinamibacterales bacterium]
MRQDVLALLLYLAALLAGLALVNILLVRQIRKERHRKRKS